MKKTLAVLFLLLALCLSGCAAPQTSSSMPAVSYEWALTPLPNGVKVEIGRTQFHMATFSDGLLPIIYKGGADYYAAYLRTDGTLLRGTLFDWDETAAFSEGCGYVKMDSKNKGFVDANGVKLFDLVYEKDGKKTAYGDYPGQFSEGLVRVDLPTNRGNSRVGYLDKTGSVVIDPLEHKWETGFPFKYGTAFVSDGEDRYSMIDTKGNVLIAFDKNIIPMDATPNGCIVVDKNTMETQILDRGGKVILNAGNVRECTESGGLIAVLSWQREENRVYDAEGKLVADLDTLKKLGIEGNAMRIDGLIDGMIRFAGTYKEQSGFGLLSPEGTLASAPIARANYLEDGYAMISDSNGYGIVDWNGTEVVPCRFEVMSPLSGGACLVREDGKDYILTVKRTTK